MKFKIIKIILNSNMKLNPQAAVFKPGKKFHGEYKDSKKTNFIILNGVMVFTPDYFIINDNKWDFHGYSNKKNYEKLCLDIMIRNPNNVIATEKDILHKYNEYQPVKIIYYFPYNKILINAMQILFDGDNLEDEIKNCFYNFNCKCFKDYNVIKYNIAIFVKKENTSKLIFLWYKILNSFNPNTNFVKLRIIEI